MSTALPAPAPALPAIYMNVYVGQTRARGWIRALESYGFGEMACRGELPPRRTPWAYDNGAFRDWAQGRAWNEAKFRADLDFIHLHCVTRPDFIVAPDVVGGGIDSLKLSSSWAPHLRHLGPIYLAVQDGQREEDVEQALDPFSGLFVGGTLPWKLRTAEAWVRFAHAHGRRCHIGRVGTEDRVRWAGRIGADSIDSSLPLWSADNLRRFLRGFRPDLNLDLFLSSPEVARG